MSKRLKLLIRWKHNTPKEEVLATVEAILVKYWGKWDKKGSHMMIHDEKLNNHEDFKGFLNIPIKGGQKVKGVYLKKIIKALEYLGEIDI